MKISQRIGLMKLLDWELIEGSADGYITTIIENETLDTDEWIEVVDTIISIKAENIINDYFYDKLVNHQYSVRWVE